MNDYHRKYYLKHRDFFLQYRKNYYQENKDIVNQRIKCEVCGRIVLKRYYKKHCLTNIHNKVRSPTPEKKFVEEKKKKILKKNFSNDGWIYFE